MGYTESQLIEMVEGVLKGNPEVFPTPKSISDIPNMPDRDVISLRIPQDKWDAWQMEWIGNSTPAQFLWQISNHTMSKVSDPVKIKILEKLQSCVRTVMLAHPNLFPTADGFGSIDGLPTRNTLRSRIPKNQWGAWQMEWIDKSTSIQFLQSFSTGKSGVSKTVKMKISEKLKSCAQTVILAHPGLFPTASGFRYIDGLPSQGVLDSRIPKKKWNAWQIEWIDKSTSEQFLQQLSASRLNMASALVNEKISKRLRQILIDKLKSGLEPAEAIEQTCDVGTLRFRIPDLDNILGISRSLTQRTDDQALVAKIGLSRADREQWVNQLLELRLEQLWFFRELMALAKTGNADNATIISFTSPSLPDRLAAILPGVSTTHVLLEDLEKGPQQLSQKSILLSVLQWLSPSRTAQLINNLSLSVPEGAEVIFTYPPTHLINPRALAELQVAGFALLRAGELCLLPEGIGDPEAQKLEQVSRLGILRRIGVGSAASEIDLFITPETAVSIGDGSNSKGATYTQADLGRAKASVVSYGVGAVVVKENVPLVVSVEAGTVDMSSKADGAVDKGILTFLDGTIAG
ncbi:MAG: hypothetical protein WCT31_03305, partial [Candidatus Micrarchaeia archaeon]